MRQNWRLWFGLFPKLHPCWVRFLFNLTVNGCFLSICIKKEIPALKKRGLSGFNLEGYFLIYAEMFFAAKIKS